MINSALRYEVCEATSDFKKKNLETLFTTTITKRKEEV